MTPLRYHEAAEEELLNEIGYLEVQARGLGRRFYGGRSTRYQIKL